MPESLEPIRNYCAYQERSHSEVRNKLLELAVYGADLEEAIATLIAEGFLNEERYARSYCRGKFRIKNWGRKKIIQHLKQKQVSEYCIRKGLEEIDETEYTLVLQKHLQQKKKELSSEKNIWIRKQKIVRYLLGKGFEQELIYEQLNED
jgi:regulatory protein